MITVTKSELLLKLDAARLGLSAHEAEIATLKGEAIAREAKLVEAVALYQGLQAGYEKANAERVEALAQRVEALAQRDKARAERDVARAERDALLRTVTPLRVERDASRTRLARIRQALDA